MKAKMFLIVTGGIEPRHALLFAREGRCGFKPKCERSQPLRAVNQRQLSTGKSTAFDEGVERFPTCANSGRTLKVRGLDRFHAVLEAEFGFELFNEES